MPTPSPKRNYPLNCWWVAAAGTEVTGQPICRWLLDRRVTLFRTEEGAVVALEDRCAHRWAPLSQGKLIGNEIVCPYHGFRYDRHGTCTHVPSQSHVPAALRVRSYPVIENGSYIWIWTGDPDRADPSGLPDIPWFTDSDYLQLRGHVEVHCNYMLIQENVLDLTHLSHLHGVQQEVWERASPDITVTDRSVTFELTTSDAPVEPFQAAPMGLPAGKRVKRRDWGTFGSPACHFAGIDVEDPMPALGKRDRYAFRAMHCTTPISPNRSHYWWAVAQDYGHHIPHLTEDLTPIVEQIAKQDQDVLEAIQTTMERERRDEDVPEVLVRADRAAVEARRILEKMLETELAATTDPETSP